MQFVLKYISNVKFLVLIGIFVGGIFVAFGDGDKAIQFFGLITSAAVLLGGARSRSRSKRKEAEGGD